MLKRADDKRKRSLRTADAFPVVASLPPKNRRERSDDRKCVCGSQASANVKNTSEN